MRKTIMSVLKENVNVDLISKNRSGNYMVRRGYFYRMGGDSYTFSQALLIQIANLGFKIKFVDHGDHWAPFKGGASVSKSSHFYAEFIIEEN